MQAAFFLTYIIKTSKEENRFIQMLRQLLAETSKGRNPAKRNESNVSRFYFSARGPVRRNSYSQRISCHSDELIVKHNV
jgi:hypothetical protein